MMGKRSGQISIWSEGTFAALKNQHNLKRIQKRGILRANEECLLAAIALNLKRIVTAMGGLLSPIWDEYRICRLVSLAA